MQRINRVPVPNSPSRQNGGTLIVILALLLVITMLGTGGSQTAITQQQISSNVNDQSIAFHAAEAALSQGEKQAQDFTSARPGHYTAHPDDDPDPEFWRAIDWDNGDSEVFSGEMNEPAEPPRYIIEELAFDSDGRTRRVRVTARGTGARESTNVILQSVFDL